MLLLFWETSACQFFAVLAIHMCFSVSNLLEIFVYNRKFVYNKDRYFFFSKITNITIYNVWFGFESYGLFFATGGLISLLLRANSERLQTSMPGVGFEPADYSTKWQRPTIRPSPGPIMFES